MKLSVRFVALLLLAFIGASYGQVSPKRGLAYGSNSLADMKAIKKGVSWWYNWSNLPDPSVTDYYASLGVEYVPMSWNAGIDVNNFISRIKPGAKYLLAFNEPNLSVESNMTPEAAAAAWPKLEQIAAAKNLEIVSAAAIYCSGGVGGYNDPVAWHTQFFKVCPTCKVDYIAFHTYEQSAGAAIYLTNLLRVFNRPIWVTEFSAYHAASAGEENQYMLDVVNSFEGNPDIFRYSWFTGRRSDAPIINLYGNDGILTALGSTYVNIPYNSKKMDVPGLITANKHYRRKGTSLETTTDGATGQNVSNIDEGDWNEFMLNVTKTGMYTLKFRVASKIMGGKFDVQVNGVTVKTDVSFPATGDWQTWADVPVTGVSFAQGENYLKIVFKTQGFNLNYINALYQSGVQATADFSATPTSTCIGSPIVFSDKTFNKSGGETYAWDFGSNATPDKATGAGPFTVSYSVEGLKSPQLTVTNSFGANTISKSNFISINNPENRCIFADDFNDNTVKWLTTGPFIYDEAGSAWNISNAGYDQWQNFSYTINNGATAAPINFGCGNYKPVLKVKAKASVDAKAVLTATLVDVNGRPIDNVKAMIFELTDSYQVFTVDFTGRFKNYYSPQNTGLVDSTNITGIQFSINPNYASPYFIKGASGRSYNYAFTGNILIDWMGIGANCPIPVQTGIELNATQNNAYAFYPNPFSNSAVLNINSEKTDKVSVKIMDVRGTTLFSTENFPTNKDTYIGEELLNGIYSVVVNYGMEVKTFKMIKIK